MRNATVRELASGVAEVRFTHDGIILANQKGMERRKNARKDGRKQTRGIEGTARDNLKSEGESILAEYAAAYYFDLWDYSPIVLRPDTDLGDIVYANMRIEVKSTDKPHGSLIIGDDAPPKRPFILAITAPPVVRLVGWHISHLCQIPEYWRSDVRFPNWFVPQRDLHPMNKLREVLDETDQKWLA